MAKKFLTSIDLNGNQLINPILENVTPNPITELAKGRLAFNTTGNVPIVYDGSSWKNLQYEIPAGTYLTENQTITLKGVITGSGKTSITTSIADDALTIAKTKGLQTALDAKMTTTSYPSLTAIQALANTSGFLKKTGASTWTIDTNSYLTASSSLSAGKLTGTIPSAVLGKSSLYVGTTKIALNRPSGALSLTGITSVAIGDAVLKYDTANNALFVEKANGEAVNLYATGEVAGFGAGSGLPEGGTGEGVSALSLLTDVSLSSASTGNVLIYNGTHWENKPQSEIVPNLSPYALKTYVDSKVAGLVDSAPETLDTLVELAEALGNDPDFATTVANNIGTKVTKNEDITPGSGAKITYDAKGLVTGSAKLTNTDIPSGITATKIAQTASYRMVSDTQISNWNTAHGWGDHSLAGYIKSFTNTTYTAKLNGGLKLVGTVFEADFGTGANQVAMGNHSHSFGVLTIATGGTNGTISVNTNGTSANVAVKGLGSAAYTASTAYAKASHNHSAANITSGTLVVARGGTGLTDAKGGFTRKVVGTLTTSATSYPITHGLGLDVVVQVIEVASKAVVECDIIMTSATVATIQFNKAPAANAYRYIIVG